MTEDEIVGCNSTEMSLSKLQETVKDRGAWHTAVHGVAKRSDTTYQLNNNKIHWIKWEIMNLY